MAERIIEVRVSPDGSNVAVDAKNFKNGVCKKFEQELAAKMGGQQLDLKKKPEYYKVNTAGVRIK